MIVIDHSPRSVIVAIVLWIVAEVFVRHMNLAPVGFVVTEFINGIGYGVSFDHHKKRRVRTVEFKKPSLAEPATRVDDCDVDQVLSVELARSGDLAYRLIPGKRVVFTPSSVVSLSLFDLHISQCLKRRPEVIFFWITALIVSVLYCPLTMG